MALRGLQVLYNLILKDIVKGSGQASGIMSIGKDVRKLADRKLQSYITAAKRQGVDLDKLSEQELKYTLELNKPKPIRAIAADSPEGQGITRDLFNMLDRRSGKNVIKTDFGKPFAEEIGSVDNIIKNIKTMKPIDSMKETNRVLRGEGKYKNLSKADREKLQVMKVLPTIYLKETLLMKQKILQAAVLQDYWVRDLGIKMVILYKQCTQ